MPEVQVGRGAGRAPLIIRINGRKPTFRFATEKIAAALVSPIEPLMEDLLNVVAAVFAADSSVRRGGPTRSEMGGGWRRQFDFQIPVRLPDLWSRPDVTEALTEAVTFLTDDDVSFRFVQSQETSPPQGYLDFDSSADAFTADEVILFSGGLDSFAGALEALSTRDGRVALVTHRSAPKVIPRQERLARYLAERFPGRVLHVQVNATRVGAEASESTQRSRSLLFASLSQVVARMFGANQVSFYENGVVSQNLPISPQVIGTMATRTTHPLALHRLGNLMDLLGVGSVPIRNPFEWLTKTDVVDRIARHGGADMIKAAVSCTSVRDQDTLHTHCGSCSQCLDRRFAILPAGLKAHDPSEMYRTDVLTGARETDLSRTMAVDWSRHALRLSTADPRAFLNSFGQELFRIMAGHPDKPRSDTLRMCLDLQKRHAGFVVDVLKRSVVDQADALSRQSLHSTSLLVLHVGGGTALVLPEDPRKSQGPLQKKTTAPSETDTVPDADRPLEVSFTREGTSAVVIVRDLCRVVGRPADVAHVLKGPFDEDRAAGLPRNAHRYCRNGDIAKQIGQGKASVAKNVDRCRQAIEDAFELVHGRPPGKDLLIETHKGKGYRLDPDLRVITPDG